MATTSETVLSGKSIAKYFYEPKRFQVLKDISLEVKAGEFLAIVGKSGSGKTTLLYVLSTMDTDFDGALSIKGQDLKNKTRAELAAFRNAHIGFVFQFHYLLPDFSAIDNVILPALKFQRRSKEENRERALELLDAVGLKRLSEKRVSLLSGGEQQRVAVARSLINDPAVVMGDEPTGNLDTKNTQMVFEILREIAKTRGQTIVAVTHDEEFAQNCDRIVELSNGRVLDSGES